MQHPWAITEQALQALIESARARIGAGRDDLKAAWADDLEPDEAKARPTGGVGVIPIRGTLKQHPASSFFDFLFGGSSYEGIAEQLRAFLADSAVRAIVLDIDSPGGSTYGMSELANEIMDARGSKPIVAVANSMACSAAYGIGAACDALYLTPGGVVGSVGVFMVHADISKALEAEGVDITLISAGRFKTRGNEYQPLEAEDVAHFQAIVNETYSQFVKDIARGRGVTPDAVRKGFGEGDVVTAANAKKLGMVDGVMTFAQVVDKALTLRSKPPKGPAAEAPEIVDDAPPADAEGEQRLRLLRWRAQQAFAATAKGVPSGH